MFETALNAAHIHITHIGRYVILLLSGSRVCVEAVLESGPHLNPFTRMASSETFVDDLD